MSRTRARFSVPPERVFATLSDPEMYADWVVGSHSIRDADANFPATGSRFYHRVGKFPLIVADHTEVLESDPVTLLVLRARARPLGTAIVRLTIEPDGAGSIVTITETAGDPLSRLVLNPLTFPLVKRRNDRSLQRLKRIAETGVLRNPTP